VSLQALSQLFCSVCSDQVVCSGLGLFGSKESFIPAVICHRGLWYVNLPVLAASSFAVSHLNKCRHIIFVAIWFRACSRVRWVVLDVCMFILVCFYLLGLDLKPLVIGINCFTFNCCKKGWIFNCCIIFYFMFNIFGIV
jgi:hypothetical protein